MKNTAERMKRAERIKSGGRIKAPNMVNTAKGTVQFSLKPHKVFLFDKQTQLRIRF